MKTMKIVALAICLHASMAHADDNFYTRNQDAISGSMMVGTGIACTIIGMRHINTCRRTVTSADADQLLESVQQPSRTALDRNLSHGLLAVSVGTTLTLMGFVPWITNLYEKVEEKCN